MNKFIIVILVRAWDGCWCYYLDSVNVEQSNQWGEIMNWQKTKII